MVKQLVTPGRESDSTLCSAPDGPEEASEMVAGGPGAKPDSHGIGSSQALASTPDIVNGVEHEIRRVVAAWPRLPDALRCGILAIIDAV
jgi:hypothetical protein